MRYSDICRKYTEIVGDYIGKGYSFYKDGYCLLSCCEMHQELVNPAYGNVKIFIARRYDGRGADGKIWYGNCLVLIVEENGKEVSRERFIPVRRNRLDDDNWFLTEEQAEERVNKKRERYASRKVSREKIETNAARKEIALRYIKRKERGCSRKTVDDIVSVDKCRDDWGNPYYEITFVRGSRLDYSCIFP